MMLEEVLKEIQEMHLVKLNEECFCFYCNEIYWCQGAVDALVASRNELLDRLRKKYANLD